MVVQMKNKADLYTSTLTCSSMISGYYRYADIFQIFPSRKINENRDIQYIDIEYNNNYRNKDKKLSGARTHLIFLKELVSLLSIATNEKYEIYFNKEEYQFLPEQEKILSFSDMSAECEISKWENKIYQPMRFGDQSVAIDSNSNCFFKKYFNLSVKNRNKYDSAMFLHEIAQDVFKASASMSFVTYISSIETLMELEKEILKHKIDICQLCKQKKYEIAVRFVEFVQKYSPSSEEKYEELLKRFYTKRSKISHTGKIFEIDKIFTNFPVGEYNEIVSISKHNRVCLFNFILNAAFV